MYWTAPASDGGSVVTGYTVTASPGGRTATTTGSTAATVTGLTNGVVYSMIVRATNAAGDSVASAAVGATPEIDWHVPSAPTNVVAVAGDASARVSWTPGWSFAGFPSYMVTAHPGGRTASGISPTATVTGLTNGIAYTFTVTASDGYGTSTASDPSAAVTPQPAVTASDAPTGVVATARDAEAVVSWTAPVSDGGSPVTGYTVTATPGGKTATTTGATSATVTGLTNGTAYTFTVTASNAAGTSAPSAASPAVTPRTVPGAPSGVLASAGNTQAGVSWTAPASDGGHLDNRVHGHRHPLVVGTATSAGAATTAVIGGSHERDRVHSR